MEKISKVPSAKKADILDMFFQRCRSKIKKECPNTDDSLFPILRLILPQLERERGAHNLKQKSLSDLYISIFCLGRSSKIAHELTQYKVPSEKKYAGCDFAAKAASILQGRFPRESSDYTIEKINLFLDDISSKDKKEKEETFKILLAKMNVLEFKWITRIILKDLKLGIEKKKILESFHPEANSLSRVSSNLRYICDALREPQLKYHHDISIFSHFKPMLLERCQIEDVEKLFGNGEQYFVQCKYDGERSQMHMKDGKYKYFTRQGFDITNKPGYGETSSSGFMSSVFTRLLKPQVKSIILDGELMGWHKEQKMLGSKGMNYDVKNLSKNSCHQICFVAFDIVMYNDDLLGDKPYERRLEILKDALEEEEGCLLLCKSVKISTREQLCEMFNESMKNEEEGIVVKKCDSKYRPNVKHGTGCYKIKAEYSKGLVQDIDLIILGGYYGDGKFMGMVNSFLMGVASPANIPGENPTKFLSVVSVSNGFGMNELKELCKMFEGKWQRECPANVLPPRLEPPNLWVRPENSIILTILATEMIQSKDYPTGYSLRFPRVVDIRTDKPWYSVCTTTELSSLIKNTRPIQKLTKPEVNCEDIEETPKAKTRKTTKRPSMLSEKKPMKFNIYDNPPVCITRLFDDKEICVISGDNEWPKEQIEKVLMQHKAKVVQNPSEKTYCIIVSDPKKPKENYYIQTKEYDVVTVDWFKRVTKEENWPSLQDFLPWDLICCRESTKCRLARYFDDYYDHYTVDTNEENLLHSFKRIEEMAKDVELDCVEMKKIDQELFDNGISPYSIFRGTVGYFIDQSDLSKFEFRFMAGTIRETIDDSVTHVFINKSSVDAELKNIIDNKSSLTIVKSDWIQECFKQNAIIPYSNYLIQ
ncbi:unnamed protein product [Xylocopa violacea]